MKIVNTYSVLLTLYEGNTFCFEKWKAYMDTALPGLYALLVSDVQKSLEAGKVSWNRDYLPVLNEVAHNSELREMAHDSFCSVTENLEHAIYDKFGKDIDVDVVFYLGLCNGAGWVTTFHGRRTILLGIEKIMELNWCGTDDMRGLIYHELGHIYQGQYGIRERSFDNNADSFLWQLFTEGVAMYFEQVHVGDSDYYHQDKDGWKMWCDTHFAEIKADFNRDMRTMTFADQGYFGDWVEYKFDEIICFDIDIVTGLFEQFVL